MVGNALDEDSLSSIVNSESEFASVTICYYLLFPINKELNFDKHTTGSSLLSLFSLSFGLGLLTKIIF